MIPGLETLLLLRAGGCCRYLPYPLSRLLPEQGVMQISTRKEKSRFVTNHSRLTPSRQQKAEFLISYR